MKTPTIVLGGTGYVAGELLRLIAAHPRLDLRAILSDSQPGEPDVIVFELGDGILGAYGVEAILSSPDIR
ncbi:MAG: hypothetical protein ACREUC_22265, partial [Steroidobacteraceae bacterium]